MTRAWLLVTFGVGLIVGGVWWWSPPAALIVAGTCAVFAGLLLDTSEGDVP